MSWDRWDEWPPSGPRRVEGGLKARSARGEIAQTWWSRRFVEVLESLRIGTRITRGRTYARAGQVLSLEIGPGQVTAAVQGSRKEPYDVWVELDTFGPDDWAAIEASLASQALFRAKLLAGDMPPEIEEVFASCSRPLFPTRPDEMSMECSCPDWAVPCKHLAAVFYLLAEAFDADPFLVLAWRGRGKEELLANLRELTGSDETAEMSAAGAPPPVEPPIEDLLDSFWTMGDLAAVGGARSISPDLVLREVEPPPLVVRGQPLADLLRPAYQEMAHGAA
jgi:uncharacterized Zn finger protein